MHDMSGIEGEEHLAQHHKQESARRAESQSQHGLVTGGDSHMTETPVQTQIPNPFIARAEAKLFQGVTKVLYEEVNRLTAENEVFIQKENKRKEKKQKAKKKWRETHRKEYNAYQQKLMQKRRAEGK
jgi:hypothetical protein